jgi:hypothetical protein
MPSFIDHSLNDKLYFVDRKEHVFFNIHKTDVSFFSFLEIVHLFAQYLTVIFYSIERIHDFKNFLINDINSVIILNVWKLNALVKYDFPCTQSSLKLFLHLNLKIYVSFPLFYRDIFFEFLNLGVLERYAKLQK